VNFVRSDGRDDEPDEPGVQGHTVTHNDLAYCGEKMPGGETRTFYAGLTQLTSHMSRQCSDFSGGKILPESSQTALDVPRVQR